MVHVVVLVCLAALLAHGRLSTRKAIVSLRGIAAAGGLQGGRGGRGGAQERWE